ncbi:MAG TPA: hypothetical protein VFD53_07655, partial [Ilumatobacter sp.]|nr:hypothetical protein [Ilumatobacter sp.]
RGNTSSASFTVSVVVGEETFDGYIEQVDEILPDGGLRNSITSKLDSAQAAFAAGDVDGAIAELNALLNQIAAKEGKKNGLTTQQASELRTAINALLDAMT